MQHYQKYEFLSISFRKQEFPKSNIPQYQRVAVLQRDARRHGRYHGEDIEEEVEEEQEEIGDWEGEKEVIHLKIFVLLYNMSSTRRNEIILFCVANRFLCFFVCPLVRW